MSKGFDLNSFRTSEVLENAGVWRNLGNEARVLIARLGNAEFSKMFNDLVAPYAETGAKVPPEVQKEITAKCLARTVVLDWENFFDGDEPVLHSYENALRFLTEVKDFRELIVKLAGDMDSYKEKTSKAIEGNSESASDGLSSSETS